MITSGIHLSSSPQHFTEPAGLLFWTPVNWLFFIEIEKSIYFFTCTTIISDRLGVTPSMGTIGIGTTRHVLGIFSVKFHAKSGSRAVQSNYSGPNHFHSNMDGLRSFRCKRVIVRMHKNAGEDPMQSPNCRDHPTPPPNMPQIVILPLSMPQPAIQQLPSIQQPVFLQSPGFPVNFTPQSMFQSIPSMQSMQSVPPMFYSSYPLMMPAPMTPMMPYNPYATTAASSLPASR